MLTIYVDASWRDGVAGLGLVCTSLTPWLAAGKFVRTATSTDAEIAAVAWASAWACGKWATVFTDCTAAVNAEPPPFALVRKIRRGAKPGHVLADNLAGRARVGQLDIEDHQIAPAPVGMVKPEEPTPTLVQVQYGNGATGRALLCADDGTWATVRLGKRGGGLSWGRKVKFPSAWVIKGGA